MDFFDSQERARKVTRRLVLLYCLAVALIIFTVYVVIAVIFLDPAARTGQTLIHRLWNVELFLTVSVITLLVIVSGTLFRVLQLRGGGASVAEMMGGRKVNPTTTDPNERRLVNVVEEMSIASGIAVPDIFIMDRENSINAFAAGYNTNDAAVAVTRGTLESLNRDELQGVIAHEFSHIFNGDMRLNIRLIGLLNGILLLHLLGFIILRGGVYGSMGSRRSSSRDQGGGAAAIMALAIGLIVIGYIGMFFGRIIQSAVSRQREFLADSAAVQYTRNPDGLAGALTKIRDASQGSQLQDAHAMELSHMFFASGFRSALDSIFATHPPIEKRLEAIVPNYSKRHQADKPSFTRGMKTQARAANPQQKGKKDTTSDRGFFSGSAASNHAFISPDLLMGAIGVLGEQNLAKASDIMRNIPDHLLNAAHDTMEAEALIYFLLINSDPEVQTRQRKFLDANAEPEIMNKLTSLLKHTQPILPEWKLPLVDISMPALKNLSEDQYNQFHLNIKELSVADNKISLFEFTLEKVLFRHLDIHYKKQKGVKIKYHNLKPLSNELSILLSALANAGEKNTNRAFQASEQALEKISPELTLFDEASLSFDKIDRSLNKLAESAGPVKKYFLRAAIACISSDDQIITEELELLRAMADTMDVPLPTL